MNKPTKETLIPLVLVALALITGGITLVTNLSNQPGSPTSVAAVPNTEQDAQISVLSVSADTTAAAAGANTRVVKWQTQNYPANATVSINLIKKISDNPNSYQLVRTLAANTPNDGTESWTPDTKESGDTFYIEVVCGNSAQFSAGCRTTSAPVRAF